MIADVHAHYFPKTYTDLLLRIGGRSLPEAARPRTVRPMRQDDPAGILTRLQQMDEAAVKNPPQRHRRRHDGPHVGRPGVTLRFAKAAQGGRPHSMIEQGEFQGAWRHPLHGRCARACSTADTMTCRRLATQPTLRWHPWGVHWKTAWPCIFFTFYERLWHHRPRLVAFAGGEDCADFMGRFADYAAEPALPFHLSMPEANARL